MMLQKAERSSSGSHTALAEINVTPLVDVMLVLLIVFMISAPMMQQGAQVDLPKANAGTLTDTPEQVVLIVGKDRRILLNDKPVPEGTLGERLAAMAQTRKDLQVFVKADQDVSYGYIARIIAAAKSAGISRVGLVTEPDNTRSKL